VPDHALRLHGVEIRPRRALLAPFAPVFYCCCCCCCCCCCEPRETHTDGSDACVRVREPNMPGKRQIGFRLASAPSPLLLILTDEDTSNHNRNAQWMHMHKESGSRGGLQANV